MSRQILLAGMIEHVGKAMAADRLKRVACFGLGIAIVDDDRRAAISGEVGGQRLGRFLPGWRSFDDGAVAIEGESAGGQDDMAFPILDELPNRQCVEEFVGDQQQRRLRQGRQRVMENGLRQQFCLRLPQCRTGLDQMDLAFESGPAHDPKRIVRQRAATRAEFGIDGIRRLSGPCPDVGQGRPDQLAEHLVNFRRRDEVAAGSKRIARRVIIGCYRPPYRPRRSAVLLCGCARRAHGPAAFQATLAGAGDRFHPLTSLLGSRHQVQPAKDHRNRQPLPHVEAAGIGEFDQLGIGLADEFDRRSGRFRKRR